MHPTSRPSRPLSWTTRRELAERLHHRTKGPLQPLQSLQSLQSLQELQALQRVHLDWSAHVGRPDFIFYSPKQIQHLIRLDTALGRAAANMVTLPPMWHDRRIHTVSTHIPYESHSTPGSRSWNEWGNLASGWAAGAILLLAALLLVRYIDRYLARKLLNLRRRQSDEWPTPNVLATSIRFPEEDDDPMPGLSEFDGTSEANREMRNDLPPPYSECARPTSRQANKHIVTLEEPPPPYSACYVAFSNPKDGVPSVHLYNGQGQRLSDAQENADGNKPDGCDTTGDNRNTQEPNTNATTSNAEASHIVDIDKDGDGVC